MFCKRILLLICLLLLGIPIWAGDYYEILQVARNAGEDQIRRAYKKLALQYHPDKVKGGDGEKKAAEQKFQEINQAYSVLSDAEKRKIYDRYGEAGLNQQQGGGDPRDFFSGMFRNFGFNFNFGEEEEATIPKGDDVILELEITLADAYVGKNIEIVREKAILVTTSGTRDCKCRQEITTRQIGPGMFQQFQKQVCEKCPNVKFDKDDAVMTLHVRPGMSTGQEISFFEEGEPVVDGDPGDLKFIVKVMDHNTFKRKQDDLYMNYTITLVEALTGFSHQMKHLDGHLFTLSSQNITRPSQMVRIENEGMPIFEKESLRGNLFVTFFIDFPSILSDSQQTDIKKILTSQ